MSKTPTLDIVAYRKIKEGEYTIMLGHPIHTLSDFVLITKDNLKKLENTKSNIGKVRNKD